MTKLHPIFDLLRSDAFITVNKLLSLSIGLHESLIFAELLSRYAYFGKRDLLTEDGFFFNTVPDLYLATSLSEKQQRAAINRLKKIGLIDYKLQGLPARRFFKVTDKHELLSELIEIGRKITRKVRYNHSSDKMAELDRQKGRSNKNNNTRPEIDPDTPVEYDGFDVLRFRHAAYQAGLKMDD